MTNNTIVYEQPLNEIIRACLRLEQLFLQVDHYIQDTSFWGTRNVITYIINILHLLDRPDLKAKLAKELSHHMANMNRLQNTPEIDQDKLQRLIHQLDDLVRCFIDSSVKIGQPLREVELLNNLRLHLASPGGGCSFDIPVYHFWLNQPEEIRTLTVKSWMAEFNLIKLAVMLILRLVREGSKIQQKFAENGFYQELLDPQINLRLIGVTLPNELAVYPEISVGRHFLSIRFYSPNIQERPVQFMQNLQFQLAYGTV